MTADPGHHERQQRGDRLHDGVRRRVGEPSPSGAVLPHRTAGEDQEDYRIQRGVLTAAVGSSEFVLRRRTRERNELGGRPTVE